MVAANHSAPQHGGQIRTPRPLPLFMEMVASVARDDPEMARRALAGLKIYGAAPRLAAPQRTVVARAGRASLLDGGGSGPAVLLVPSLINSSAVLDLDTDRSLLGDLAAHGFRPMLVDWGCPSPADAEQTIGDHILDMLIPLIDAVGEPVHLVGYCLGGTMALAAAALRPVRSLTLLATPWHFDRYPLQSQQALARLWTDNAAHVREMGLAPVELLQTAFWGLDPDRTVAKFAALAGRNSEDPYVANFVAVEDWANSGAPLTAAAAGDLFTWLGGADRPGAGQWAVGGRIVDAASLGCPALHLTALDDRIAPVETAPVAIRALPCPSGHVGMIVGSRAEQGCRKPLRLWLAQH